MAAAEVLITEHIDLWTAAVKRKSSAGRGAGKKLELYGIKKLRELILDMAVRGLLVPQDPDDEPASVLLERIAAEKAELVRTKTIKKPKILPEITLEEKFISSLPSGWIFVRLNDLGEWGAGATPSRRNPELYGGNIPWFKSGELTADYISESEETVTELALKKSSLRYNKSGDVLLAMYGATIGKTSILSTPATTNQAVCACTPFSGFENTFLLTLLKAYRPRFIGMGAGGAQPNISREKIISTVIALPPTAEQTRIVAKVDELMALCDQLEQRTEANISAHQTLVEILLTAVTGNGANSAESIALLFANFDSLFTTEDSVDQLKQTILQLAVMGKLVPQDPNDEPASVLLEKIAVEKEKLIKNKIYQKTGKLLPKENLTWPKNWSDIQIGEICPSIVPNRDKPKSFTGHIPWVTLPDFPTNSFYLEHEKVQKKMSPLEVEASSARIMPENSVLMSCVGRFGLTAINEVEVTCNQQVHGFVVLSDISTKFLSIVIKVASVRLAAIASSTTVAYLNKSKCESIQFGMPPLAEQYRIVAKVDELMTLCDQLKTRLNTAQTTQLHLADTVTEQAIV